jgi:hypothetical protein
MKFRYDTRYTEQGFEMVPRVPVIFRNPKTGMEIPVFCLVDSGASEILINAEIAKALGIEIIKGKQVTYGGIGGEQGGYRHTVTMQLMGDKQEFEVGCGVVDFPLYDGLLGQIGFFDNYKVIFEKYKKRFEVIVQIPKKSRGAK